MDIDLDGKEWGDVVKRLMIAACALIPRGRVVPGLGIDAYDLVQETLRRLLDPGSSVKWNSAYGKPTVLGVTGFLLKVLKNYFLDQVRKGAAKNTVSTVTKDDGNARPDGVGTDSDGRESLEEELVRRLYLEQRFADLRRRAETANDIEVVFFLDLQLGDGGPYTNAEAAKQLGMTPSDIVNVKKRMDRLAVSPNGRRELGNLKG